jgi:hypothetical protein
MRPIDDPPPDRLDARLDQFERLGLPRLFAAVEEPAPSVITITEFEETKIRDPDRGPEPPQEYLQNQKSDSAPLAVWSVTKK